MKKITSILIVFCLLFLNLIPVAIVKANQDVINIDAPETSEPFYADTFIISAYYSPLPGQNKYATGSYEGDIRLNGNGTNGADGTQVYPGMIAAPSKYAFGTKMHVPGIGIVAVHDRGGAIVSAGERSNAHDRLDVWMGFGEAGLIRALTWGKRTVQVTVYGIAPSVEEQIYLENYSEAERFVENLIYPTLTFPSDIYFGSEGENVIRLQTYLFDWGYYDEEPNGFYGSSTAQAIFEFQLDNNIVSSPDELGSGHFGINTRHKFEEIIQSGNSELAIKLKKGRTLMKKHADLNDDFPEFSRALKLGDSGDDVKMLQQELIQLGFLRIEPSGYFGDVTEHAVFKFQQSRGLVTSVTDRGAGYVGPATRKAFNEIIGDRLTMKSLIAYEREEISSGRKLLKIPERYIAVKEED